PIRTNADVLAARSAYLAASDLEGFHPALDWLTRRLRDLEPIPHSYVHMDFHPKNIILTQAGPMVFDWGSFALADPRADLAWTLLLASTYMGPEVAGGILSAYKRTRPEGLGDLEFFEVSAVWRRFATIMSILENHPPSDLRDEILEGVRLLEPAYRRLVEATRHPIPEVEHLF
ncbi:MAG: phosphotransferase family protein, partial [Acidimicrobiia bacterium]